VSAEFGREIAKPRRIGDIEMMGEARWRYLIVWEFRPRPGAENRFEEVYGPGGVWAQLFQRTEGFLGTALVRDENERGRFLTMDAWESKQAYQAFRDAYQSEYEKLDAECEGLTESEKEIGKFERV
jgi:heme-degrading monooxygenase HmoA